MGFQVTAPRAKSRLCVLALGTLAWLQAGLVPVAAAESEGQVAALVAAGFEDDADEFQAFRARGGALFGYESDLRFAGVALQNTHYSTNGWSTDAPAVIGLYRDQRRDTLEGVRAEGGLVQVDGRTRIVGDATWSHRPRPDTGVELIMAGDLVGTREALERGIAYGLAGASIEQQFGERFTAVAMAGWQPFTDGNSRALLRTRLIWSLLPEQGISTQLRWRQYSSSEQDVDGAYFNPDRYRNWDAAVSLRRRIGQWMLAGLAGAGQERIDDGSWQSTALAEARAEGPVARDMHLAVSVLYSNAAGFANSPDYWYGALNVSLIIPFGAR
jgi:hypothetical protein